MPCLLAKSLQFTFSFSSHACASVRSSCCATSERLIGEACFRFDDGGVFSVEGGDFLLLASQLERGGLEVFQIF